jgi:hypothetical protein
MANGFNKKLAELLGKMDEKVLQAKINAALDMLKNGNTEDLAKKIGKIDKNELMSKLNEMDDNKLKEMNIDKNEIKQKVNDADLQNLQKLLGEQGKEIMEKLKTLLDK